MTKPAILYKYRNFSSRTVEQLCLDQMWFADPSTFNDPLDTKPCLIADVDLALLKRVAHQLVRSRNEALLAAAAKSMSYRGPKTKERIAQISEGRALRLLEQTKYLATDPEYEDEAQAHKRLLAAEIEHELLLQYDKGVVSLAERCDCPLMWSHYGDQHRGICVGYSVPPQLNHVLQEVEYGGNREVPASSVASMILEEDERARCAVDSAVMFRKAKDWHYEREWRLLGRRGLVDSPLDLSEIIFGMRCTDAVKYTVVRALEAVEDAPPRFYEISPEPGTFVLRKNLVDTEELCHSYPRSARENLDGFVDELLEVASTSDSNQSPKSRAT